LYHRDEDGRVIGSIELACEHGVFVVVLRRVYDHQNPSWVRDIDLSPVYRRYSYFDLRRQRLHADSNPMFIMTTTNELGLWAPVLLFAGYPVIAFVRGPLRRYRRRRMGRCRKCGYDLTGNVSGRCPECGTPVGSEKEAL
jgi:hypothetical protein